MIWRLIIFLELSKLIASKDEVGRWRTGNAPHAAGEEVTVDELEPE
jgi:hypothetical protein